MTPARLSTQQAADTLGISPSILRGIATRRGWIAEGDTWCVSDIRAEGRQRTEAAGGRSSARDSFTKAGAERIAETIRSFWTKRGKAVEVWIEPTGDYLNVMRTANWYVVRSNMRDGRPPDG